nr:hypothetical protein I308_03767 [Cryptococcus tetragattii IND107]
MTDQNKPRPKVTSHITSTPSHSPSTTYKASIRAKVTPSAITASQTPPGASSKASLKSTPSSSSLRAHVSASSAGTPRTGARSPLQRTPSTPAPVPQARVTKPFQAQRSPLTPGFAPSSGRPSSSSSSVSASGVASGTPVAVPRVRAAKSALGLSSVSNSSASKRKNNTESGTGSRSRSRSGNDDGSEYEQTPDAQARRYAVDKATTTVGTNGRIDRAPRARVKLQPQPQTQAQTGLQNQGSHLPPHVPYYLLTHPTASAPASPIHYSQLQDPNPDIQAQDQDPNLPSATSTTTSFTMTRRTSKPRLPPMVLHPSERQQALKEGRKIVGAASVGSGMRMMPGSPEMKTVELPALTPRVPGTPVLAGQGNGEWKDDEKNGYGNREKSTEQEEVTNKTGGEGEGIKRGRVENEVEIEAGTEEKGKEEQEVDDMLGTDAVEAKINRKIADLEISNASLLAINQALEATKSKQRAEIGKLRRRLRETLAFPHLSAGGASGGSASSFGRGFGAGFGGSHSNSGLDLGTSTLEDEPEPEHDFDLFLLHEAEMADPQLDARWCKMEDLVLGMKKAAEEAVRKGEEDGSREGRGRVLGWAEMEEMRDMGDGDASFTSEGNGERSEEEEGTVS